MSWHKWLRLGVVSLALVTPIQTTAWADEVSGMITRTYVIVEDTDLVGDVVCDVSGNPCFSFGASGVELRLNGFSITGKADAVTGCGGASTPGEAGIHTSGQPNVSIRGPGLVQRFRIHGVFITSANARVEGITTSTNCLSGIFVGPQATGALVERNVSVRNGSTAPGASCGGICIAGHNSRVRLNAVNGNGYADPADDFGIGLVGTATGNAIDENTVMGNTNGIRIAAGARETKIGTTSCSAILRSRPAIRVRKCQPSTFSTWHLRAKRHSSGTCASHR